MSKRIPPLDLSWLVLESPDTPMHVGGLLTFTLPDAAPEDYLYNVAARLREQRGFQAPWNLKVGQGLRDKLVPRWVEDSDLDLEHHFRHTALPKPGGEREASETSCRTCTAARSIRAGHCGNCISSRAWRPTASRSTSRSTTRSSTASASCAC